MSSLISTWQGWTRKEPAAIGLDVGVHSIKAVLLKRASQEGLTLAGQASITWTGVVEKAERAQALQQFIQGMNCARSRLRIAVGGPGTVVRSVTIPKMTPAELKAALNFEVEKYIPFRLEEVFLESAILGDQPGGRMEVILAAARKELVCGRLDLLAAAGLTPRGLEVEAVALANAWEVSHPVAWGNEPAALVHMGARGTILNFQSGPRFEFTREIPLGGQSFTQAVAEGLKVDLTEAERLKCRPGDRQQEVRAALQPAWEEWLGQCRASFDFYESQFGRRVLRLALGGGAVRLAGLKEWVQEATGLGTEFWNPIAGLKGSTAIPESDSVGLGVAVGLAVSEVKR